MDTPAKPDASCSGKKACAGGFNFCFWAKLLVAIPALPVIAFMASFPFSDSLSKLVAAAAGVGGAVWLAVWIDRLPALQKKVIKK